jgi:hypothetical protein
MKLSGGDCAVQQKDPHRGRMSWVRRSNATRNPPRDLLPIARCTTCTSSRQSLDVYHHHEDDVVNTDRDVHQQLRRMNGTGAV